MDTKKDWKNTSFPELEQEIINYWENIHAIDKIIATTKNYPKVVYCDGPPFATGKLHYGHILVSTVKDTMTRYLTMNGYHVDRGYGYDCHGVPVEMLAKKEIGYNTKQQLLEYGIDRHNDVCRKLVSSCADHWYKMFVRIGRWIDPQKEYKTMDFNFMESVIWAFKKLYDSGMIFEGYKVMPYSTGCNTPLSHFEAKQNYKMTTDISVTCCFEIISTEHSIFKQRMDYPSYILAWTTTPWTLPSNMALCTYTNGEIIYAFDYQNQYYILVSKEKFESTYANLKYNINNRFTIIERVISSDLINIEYKPPFQYFWEEKVQKSLPIGQRAFRVVADHFVKESGQDSGTGFVQCAAAYGEDDFRVCCENGIIDSRNSKRNIINPIDDDGCFTDQIPEYKGIYIKDANKLIIRDLKLKNLLFDTKPYNHSYPFCYRTDTPLIYRIVTAWFLNAANEEFREKMLANNKKINWMPPNVGTNHFDNWLQGSVDWCISRSRYWGTPIPIWRSDDGNEIICIGSVAELEELSGTKNIKDLHIEHIDKIKIPSKRNNGMLSRVDGVLDCWFESGSMPYAQSHYPFENKDVIDLSKPCISDFITESKDQTRGWFYTLTVLSTAIFNKPAFENVIVTGIINGTDGQKMAKSKGNYPDPSLLINKYGADTLRLYLLSTPVVKAESIRFDETALSKLQQNSIVKIYNIALFLVEKINLYNKIYPDNMVRYPDKKQLESLDSILDKWIISKTGSLLREMKDDLDKYKINSIISKIMVYTEQLTNWYLKMARERLKGFASKFNNEDDGSWKQSLETLLFVLDHFIKMVSPFMPFITETIYNMIKPYLPNPNESIHFEKYPNQNEFIFDEILETKFSIVQKVIILIREVRDNLKLNLRRPLACVEIGCTNDNDWYTIQNIMEYIISECNIIDIKKINPEEMIVYKTNPNMLNLSTYLKEIGKIKQIRQIVNFINGMDQTQIKNLLANGSIIEPFTDTILKTNQIGIETVLKENIPESKMCDGIIVKLDTSYSVEVKWQHLFGLVSTAIQLHRKYICLKPWQIVKIYYYTESDELKQFIEINSSKFCSKNIERLEPKCADELLNNTTKHEILNNNLMICSEPL